MTAPFDLSRYQDPLTIQRVLHTAKTDRDRRAVEESSCARAISWGSTSGGMGTASFRSTRARRRSSGRRASSSLADVPVPVDIVNVFRAPDALPGIAREAVAIGAKNLWCQFSVINEEGARIAEAGGLSVVMDRCIKVEHARYVGRMHWLGFNTQRITSVRGGLQ